MRHKLCKIGHHPKESLRCSDDLRLRHLQHGLYLLKPWEVSSWSMNFMLDWFRFTLARFNFSFHKRHFLRKACLCLFETVVYFSVTNVKSGNQEVICYHFHSFQILHKHVLGALSHFRCQMASGSIGTAQMVCWTWFYKFQADDLQVQFLSQLNKALYIANKCKECHGNWQSIMVHKYCQFPLYWMMVVVFIFNSTSPSVTSIILNNQNDIET